MPAKIKILGPDNIWKYKEVTPEYAEGFFTHYVTSSLYPIVIIESLTGSGSITDTRTDYHTDTGEEITGYGFISNISIETTDPIFPKPYSTEPEEIRGYGFISNVLKEEIGGGTPILYTQWPAEPLQGRGFISSVLKETS